MPRIFGPLEEHRLGTPTGLFKYCCQSVGPALADPEKSEPNLIFPVGLCSLVDTCPHCQGLSNPASKLLTGSGVAQIILEVKEKNGGKVPQCEHCHNTGYAVKAEPCYGHDTPAAAVEHFAQYIIERANYQFQPGELNGSAECEVCRRPTKTAIRAPYGFLYVLCRGHRVPDVLRRLIEPEIQQFILP